MFYQLPQSHQRQQQLSLSSWIISAAMAAEDDNNNNDEFVNSGQSIVPQEENNNDFSDLANVITGNLNAAYFMSWRDLNNLKKFHELYQELVLSETFPKLLTEALGAQSSFEWTVIARDFIYQPILLKVREASSTIAFILLGDYQLTTDLRDLITPDPQTSWKKFTGEVDKTLFSLKGINLLSKVSSGLSFIATGAFVYDMTWVLRSQYPLSAASNELEKTGMGFVGAVFGGKIGNQLASRIINTIDAFEIIDIGLNSLFSITGGLLGSYTLIKLDEQMQQREISPTLAAFSWHFIQDYNARMLGFAQYQQLYERTLHTLSKLDNEFSQTEQLLMRYNTGLFLDSPFNRGKLDLFNSFLHEYTTIVSSVANNSTFLGEALALKWRVFGSSGPLLSLSSFKGYEEKLEALGFDSRKFLNVLKDKVSKEGSLGDIYLEMADQLPQIMPFILQQDYAGAVKAVDQLIAKTDLSAGFLTRLKYASPILGTVAIVGSGYEVLIAENKTEASAHEVTSWIAAFLGMRAAGPLVYPLCGSAAPLCAVSIMVGGSMVAIVTTEQFLWRNIIVPNYFQHNTRAFPENADSVNNNEQRNRTINSVATTRSENFFNRFVSHAHVTNHNTQANENKTTVRKPFFSLQQQVTGSVLFFNPAGAENLNRFQESSFQNIPPQQNNNSHQVEKAHDFHLYSPSD